MKLTLGSLQTTWDSVFSCPPDCPHWAEDERRGPCLVLQWSCEGAAVTVLLAQRRKLSPVSTPSWKPNWMGSSYPAGLSLPIKDSGPLSVSLLPLSRAELDLGQINAKASGSLQQFGAFKSASLTRTSLRNLRHQRVALCAPEPSSRSESREHRSLGPGCGC